MATKRLALRVTSQSLCIILGVYLVMQVFTFFKDGFLLGMTGLSALPGMVLSFMATTVLPPSLALGLLIYLYALRIQRVGERLEAGEAITPEEAERARTRILGFSAVVLAANLVGFAAGYVLFMALKGRVAELIRPDRLVILISNLAGGVIYASAQTALHDMAFADIRERLGIQEIGSSKRERRSTTRQILLTVSIAVYVVTFVQFNVRDAPDFDAVGDEVLAGLVSGAIAPDEAETEYRRLLEARMGGFISRPDADPALVPLPWERPDGAATREQRIFFIYALFALVVAAGVQAAVSSGVAERLTAISNRVKDVLDGGGDLGIRLNLRSMDDLGEMTELINRLLDRFHSVARDIGRATGQTRESSEAIDRELSRAEGSAGAASEAVRSLESSLQEQAAATRGFVAALRAFRDAVTSADAATEDQKRFVAETSAAMEEMAASIRSISTMTERAGALTGELAERGDSGGAAVRDTKAAIDEIDAAATEVLGVLASLNKISADINLLAMNAAIEAAHAGERGAGFAVVADEVRTLAGNAAQRTKAIKDLIAAMGGKVRNGVQRADASAVALTRLVEGIRESAAISSEIAEAAREQAAGTDVVIGSITKAVDSAEAVSGLMTDQSSKSDGIARSLEEVLARLEALAESASRQSDEVRALEESFSAVRREVDANLRAVGALDAQMARFKV